MINVLYSVRDQISMEKDDVHLSYLPLPHLFERAVYTSLTFYGASIYFFSGDIMKLKDDLATVKPTFFATVPRLHLRFHDLIKEKLKSEKGVKKWLIDWAYATKLNKVTTRSICEDTIWDRIIFKKTKELFGGRVKWMLTGSAPINHDALNFLKIIGCCPIYEAYGMTETTAASFLT